jgi:outer membrane biosynthesis protein TonB
MRAAAIISVAFHLAVVAVAWVGVPVLFRNDDFVEAPILVELVMIDEVTTTREQAAEADPEPEPVKPPERRPPPPPPAPAPPSPPPPEQVAALEPVPAPTPAVKPEPVAPPHVAPPPEPKPRQRVTEVPRRKPAPPSRTEPFDAGRIAALIDRARDDEHPPPPPPEEPDEEPEEEAKPFTLPEIRHEPVNEGVRVSALPLTMSEIDAIRLQIQKCWSVPAGARDAENLVVRIEFRLNPDGSLRGEPVILDRERMERPGQEFFRAAAESARRAVLQCTPLTLPPEKYESWKDIKLNFDPRDMLGG